MYGFIFVLIICIASSALVAYSSNNAKLWKDVEIDIRKPSVYDLEDIGERYVIDKYVKEVIGKYYDYCVLKKEIEKLQGDSSVNILLILTGLPACYWYAISEAIMDSFSNLSTFWAKVIAIAVTLLIAVLPHIIVLKFFPAPEFTMSEQELIECYRSSSTSPAYPISEKTDINIYILSRHHWFLFCIHNRENTLHTIKIIGYVLAIITIFI